MPKKTIICLAKSFKNGAYCVAGIEVIGSALGGWIRPVSNRVGGSINTSESTYSNGDHCALLDIVEIDFVKHSPENYQSENWLITSNSQWRKVGTATALEIMPAMHDGHGPLWPYTGHTKGGMHDRIEVVDLGRLTSSLKLVRPAKCTVSVAADPFKNNKLNVRASFEWGGQSNNLMVTHPDKARYYQGLGVGVYEVIGPTLTISVGEVFKPQNAAFKLVAAIIP